jgi:hypothetical protein
VHPAESIWIQQGQRQVLEAAISDHPLTKGKINFTDQTVNGKMALLSSETREFVTLDLKEASDRLSPLLIQYLLGETVYGWLSCSRANKVKLLDGRVIDLQKWAPMGNALTFPVQSLVFWCLVYASIVSKYGDNCTEIYVFGDDIIYPSKYHRGVLEYLVASGLVPNTAKTFVRGFFRESCGVDAYHGEDVTPLRVKADNVNSIENIVSILSLAKRMRLRKYECCATFLYSLVRDKLGKLPKNNDPECQALVEYVDKDWVSLMVSENVRFNRRFHTWGYPALLVTTPQERVSMGDWYHLQDSLIRLAHMRLEISDRGTVYPLPYRTRLKYGWTNILQS